MGRPSLGTKIQVRLPDDLIRAVDVHAAAERPPVSRAEVIRCVLGEWANLHTKPLGGN